MKDGPTNNKIELLKQQHQCISKRFNATCLQQSVTYACPCRIVRQMALQVAVESMPLLHCQWHALHA